MFVAGVGRVCEILCPFHDRFEGTCQPFPERCPTQCHPADLHQALEQEGNHKFHHQIGFLVKWGP